MSTLFWVVGLVQTIVDISIQGDSEIVLKRLYYKNIQNKVKYNLRKFLYLNKAKIKGEFHIN